MEGQERTREVMEGLHSASGFLRRELAVRVDLRVFPKLRFHWDPTPERADHIERILAGLRSEEEAKNSSTPAVDEIEEDDDDE